MDHPTQKETNFVPVLNTTVNVMDLLHEKGSLNLSEIVSQLGSPKTTIYRILKTLDKKQWVTYTEKTGKYSISSLFLRYCQHGLQQDIVRHFNAIVSEWQEKIAHTIQLAVVEGQLSIFVAVKHPNHTVIPNTYIGKYAPVHASAAGKVFLASNEHLLHEVLETDLEAYTPYTVTQPKQLQQEIKKVQKMGYAWTTQEAFINLCCLAAPVKDANGEVCAAVDICIPTQQITDSQFDQLVPLLLVLAKTLSKS